MSRIASVFARPGHKALIPYVTMGYPSVESTLKVVPMLAAGGCDIIELGIPFSDPLADGTTIQKASFHALQNGVTTRLCFEIARELSNTVNVPLVFMTYYNLLLRHGLAQFCAWCVGSGIDGMIIPDLPPEEGAELAGRVKEQSLDLIYLLAPTSTAERIRMVADSSSGFIYLVSVTGVTGARDRLPQNVVEFVSRVREVAHQPLCLGFGISSAEQAGDMARLVDGVIVGSRLIQLMEADDSLQSVDSFVRDLRRAIDMVTA